ncbi:FAD-dependent oxidoreductase [Actinoplanes xinjiangensis]|uniref:2-polyprenyl-6-methoxyphenol hydroxylase-like FAD-dependent oxidoreductase n=1 Tax=Actinoplanes xinjiangensis TaxID=512350 RepID=A0A316FKR0_9ACTN|nr:squalene monooxygenase [Actinoplanes xinjiangensis]PWK49488.1 2-polyprenyl-6-methoxyphenol hydroxylase-like FAD-dependent oxidoreductase [Actinoplanes xinjiangensis]GIF37494.1 FAD-binding monooxygenase [Actinoplanes xinjiangensis]
MTHAVIIGASVGGLLAARALSGAFEQVTVLERDRLPAGAAARRGVPQSRQAHALLARGSMALDELFPGFVAEMLGAGVPAGDLHADCHWYLDGHPMRRAPSSMPVYGVTRPLLEHLIRERVRALPNVTIIDAAEVTGLLHDGRIRGVRTSDGTIGAGLVVDAGGRASRLPFWLRELGYGEVPVSTVRTGVVYTTRHYRYEPGRIGFAVINAPYPGMPRTGVTIRQEGDRVVLFLGGILGEAPPADDAGVMAFAESLPGPEIRDFLRTAEPLDDPVRMRVPASVRRHYERMPRLPEGLVAVGDAVCSFNPIYGQGITVAALQALALSRTAGTGRWFAGAARTMDVPWSMATATDLRFPQVAGPRRAVDRPLDAYLRRYRAAAAHDPDLGAAFLRVSNMLAGPAHLLTPGRLLRVLLSPVRRR